MESLSLPLVAFVELQETVTDILKLPYLKLLQLSDFTVVTNVRYL